MFFLFASIIFQAIIILSYHINIFPELYLLPWITSFGKIPYVDFIDHHGFLLYIILAPLSHIKSLLLIKLFFLIIQTINLILVFFILRKRLSSFFSFIYSVIFVCLSFFLMENNLWYETCIISLLLGMYYVYLNDNIRGKGYIIGIFAALASFIKPNAVLFIIPYLFLSVRRYIFLAFVSLWLIIFSFYGSLGKLEELFFGLFGYNIYLLQHYIKPPFSQQKFWLLLLVLLCFQLLLAEKRKHSKQLLFTFSLFFFSFIFVGMGYIKEHLSPFITFYIILSALCWSYTKTLYKPISSLILFFLLLISFFQALRTQATLSTRPHNKDNDIMSYIQQLDVLEMKHVFILSLDPQDYYQSYLLASYPTTQFPISFPHIETVIPSYSQTIIQELKNQQIRYIVISDDFKQKFSTGREDLFQFIEDNYVSVAKPSSSTIYMVKD